jgi:hypothetical protein
MPFGWRRHWTIMQLYFGKAMKRFWQEEVCKAIPSNA